MKPNPPTSHEEKYLLGIPEIDAQHAELSDLAVKLKEIVASKNQRHLIHPVLRRLYHLLSQHFTSEEALMEMVAYANLPLHRKTHRGLLKMLSDCIDKPIAPGDFEYFGRLIGDKILNHIMEHDVKLIAMVREKLPALPTGAVS